MGNAHGNSNLSNEIVLAIYDRCLKTDMPFTEIAKEFGVSAVVARNIATKRNHRRVTDDLPECDADNRRKAERRPPQSSPSTMTAEKAKEVKARTKLGQSIHKIVKNLGVTRHMVRSIQIGRTWRDA